MTIGYTEQGFIAKTAQQIIDDVNDKHFADWGSRFDPDADLLGRHVTAVAAELSSTWEAIAGLFTSLDPETNSGVAQAFTSSLINVKRQLGSKTTLFNVELRGNHGASVTTSNFKVGYLSATYVPFASNTLSDAESSRIRLSMADPQIGDNVQFQVNGSTFLGSLTDPGGAFTNESAVDQLVDSINNSVAVNTEVLASKTIEEGIAYTDLTPLGIATSFNFLEVNGSTLIKLFTAKKITMVSEEDSNVSVPSESNLQIILPASDITAAVTTEVGRTGRLLETPAELRVRRKQSFSTSGGGALDAIIAKVADLEGAASVLGINNPTLNPVNGLPAKSYSIIVSGTVDDTLVAETILKHGPAGIEPFGDTNISVTDSSGTPTNIGFSRTTPMYVHVEVTYTDFDEGITPANIEDLIKTTIMDASLLKSKGGVDLLPQVYEGAVTYNVPGIETAVVRMSVTPGINDSPTYTTNRIVISNTQVPEFNISRIQVIHA